MMLGQRACKAESRIIGVTDIERELRDDAFDKLKRMVAYASVPLEKGDSNCR